MSESDWSEGLAMDIELPYCRDCGDHHIGPCVGYRDCMCNDPENCTEAVSGFRCKAGRTVPDQPTGD